MAETQNQKSKFKTELKYSWNSKLKSQNAKPKLKT